MFDDYEITVALHAVVSVRSTKIIADYTIFKLTSYVFLIDMIVLIEACVRSGKKKLMTCTLML